MFDIELSPPPVIAPPEDVIDCLVEDQPGTAEPVRWSEYIPDGLLADMLAHPAETDLEYREFESLERVGAWERAGPLREMASFLRSPQARNTAMGASTSRAHESAVADRSHPRGAHPEGAAAACGSPGGTAPSAPSGSSGGFSAMGVTRRADLVTVLRVPGQTHPTVR